MLPSGRSWITPRGLLAYPFVPVTVQKIALSKLISQEFASYVGLPVPATLVLPRQATELDDFLDTHKVVVVKPLDSYGSHGLTYVSKKEICLHRQFLMHRNTLIRHWSSGRLTVRKSV